MAQNAAQVALTAAQDEWQAVFRGGPYTGLKMLEYILSEGHIEPVDFLLKPDSEAVCRVTPEIISKQDITKMAITWASRTGRCTSLAVKVVHDLARTKDGNGQLVYDFCIYDLGRHRIARCRKTGIVIDSSSTLQGGAFVLPEGNWQTFEDTNASWKYSSSESKFESRGNAQGRVKSSSTPISAQLAMVQCLKEIGEDSGESVPTLFRTIDKTGVGKFYGMIVWAPKAHAIKMARNAADWRAKKLVTIQWAQYKRTKAGKLTEELRTDMVGTEQDLEACVLTLEQWVAAYGGPNMNGPDQWAADGINMFSIRLFQAATDLWGCPKLIEEISKPKS